MNIEQVNQLIRGRRSVYPPMYTGETIPDEVVMKVLENANWAPTHKYTEPWRFKVLKGKVLKSFFDYVIDHYQNNTPPESFKPARVKKFQMFKEKVSHVAAIYMRRDPEHRVPEMEEILAVGAAAQNIYLSLEAHGLGGFWSTGMGTFSPRLHQKFGLEEEDKLLGLFLMGITEKKPPAKERGPIEEKVEWVSEEF